MQVADIARATGIFVVTNLDDLVLLSLFFARAGEEPARWRRVVAGQYLGMLGIMAISLAAALGASLLPDAWLAYLGLVPLGLGIREAVGVARHRTDDDDLAVGAAPLGVWFVASVTLANGGDNVAVYVPVLANSAARQVAVLVVAVVVLTGLWCAMARWIATRPSVARTLARRGHVLLPVVLIALGLVILVEGGAFGW